MKLKDVRDRLPTIQPQSLQVLTLTALLAITLAAGASSIVRGMDLSLSAPLSLGSVFLGWAILSVLRSDLLYWGIMPALGILTSLLRLAELEGQLIRLLVGGLVRAGQWIQVADLPSVEDRHLETLAESALQDLSVLVSRFSLWFIRLIEGEPITDPIATSLLWGFSLWIAMAWAVWMIKGQDKPLGAILPSLILLSFGLAMVGGPTTYILLMLGCGLLLAIFKALQSRNQVWLRFGDSISWSIQEQTTKMGLLLTAFLVGIAALAPTISLDAFLDRIRALTTPQEGSELSESFGLEPARARPAENALSNVRSVRLPNSHLIGNPPELAEEIVAWVWLESPQATSKASTLNYLRNVTYDRYIGRGWLTGGTRSIRYQSNALAIQGGSLRQAMVTQRVRMRSLYRGHLFAIGELVSVNSDYTIQWRNPPSAEGQPDYFGAMSASTRYTAQSQIPLISESGLIKVEPRYPQSIREPYLDLPEDLPQRVYDVANELTATQPTPYDRAAAIEAYLRRFPYNLEVPNLPLDVDIADYFLFSLQEGYCDYFATTMVVLARAAGIPARFAVGYLIPDPPVSGGSITITRDMAHSWAELYFPGYGWVPFEATSGRPAVERPLEQPLELESPERVEAARPPLAIQPSPSHLLVLATVITLLPIIGISIDQVHIWRLRRLPAAELIKVAYRRVFHDAGKLGIVSDEQDTPLELESKLLGFLQKQTPRYLMPSKRVLTEDLHSLTAEYLLVRYGPEDPLLTPGSIILERYLPLRRLLRFHRLRRWFSRRGAMLSRWT